MTKINTNIPLDPELIKSAQILLEEFGMDLSTAVTIFLKQTIREQAIPFKISTDISNPLTLNVLEEYQEMRKNKTAYKSYTKFADIIKDAESSND